jgi:hypothetical protein
MHLPQVKKEIYNSKLNSSPKTYENVDMDHVYIQFNQEFHSWSEGEIVVNTVSVHKFILIFQGYMQFMFE